MTVDKDNTTTLTARHKSALRRPREADPRQIDETTSDYDREKLQERLAKLSAAWRHQRRRGDRSGMKERKPAWKTRCTPPCAAVEEGIVPGGGVACCAASRPWKRSAPTARPSRCGHCQARPGRAGPPDRNNAGSKAPWSSKRSRALKTPWVSTPTRAIRRPDQGRRHRPDQGHPLRAA